MIKYICTACDLEISRSLLLEQVCHDENGDHYFIFVCHSCDGEVDEVDSNE